MTKDARKFDGLSSARFCVLVAVLLAFVLAGCGKQDAVEPADQSQPVSEDTATRISDIALDAYIAADDVAFGIVCDDSEDEDLEIGSDADFEISPPDTGDPDPNLPYDASIGAVGSLRAEHSLCGVENSPTMTGEEFTATWEPIETADGYEVFWSTRSAGSPGWLASSCFDAQENDRDSVSSSCWGPQIRVIVLPFVTDKDGNRTYGDQATLTLENTHLHAHD